MDETKVFSKHKRWVGISGALWLTAMCTLSHLSEFSVFPPPGAQIDSEIAAMLTPFGIVQNLVFGVRQELIPHYFSSQTRQSLFASPGILALYLTVFLSAVRLLKGLQRPKAQKEKP